MNRTSFRLLLIFLSVVLLSACATVPYSARKSPYKSVRLWNDALLNGNIKRAKALSHTTSSDYFERMYQGIEGLSAVYQKAREANGGSKSELEYEILKGDKATVAYIVYYKNGAIKKYTDTLIKEDGIWKVAPQYVKIQVIKSVK